MDHWSSCVVLIIYGQTKQHIRDHTQNDEHTHSISLLKKKQAEPAGLGPSVYAPIARAFNKLPDGEKEKLKLKFDIANFVATENLPLLL